MHLSEQEPRCLPTCQLLELFLVVCGSQLDDIILHHFACASICRTARQTDISYACIFANTFPYMYAYLQILVQELTGMGRLFPSWSEAIMGRNGAFVPNAPGSHPTIEGVMPAMVLCIGSAFSGDMHIDANIKLTSPCHSYAVRVDENVLPTCQLLLVVCGAAR